MSVAGSERLSFYPAPNVAYFQYWSIAAASALALGAGYQLLTPSALSAVSLLVDLTLLALSAAGIVTAVLAWRRSVRIANARQLGEPQLSLDRFGIEIRSDMFWRKHRFAWSRISSIETKPEANGLSIILFGELKPMGRRVEVLTDSQEDAEWVLDQIHNFRRLPTLH